MHRHALNAGQAALALALVARTSGAQSASDCVATRAARLPLIGTGTFLVAAYLASSLCPNSSPDSDRAESNA